MTHLLNDRKAVMLLRQLLGGLGRRPVGSRRSSRRRRPDLEPLEQRGVMTVVFEPVFGAETIFWRANNTAGHPANQVVTGRRGSPTTGAEARCTHRQDGSVLMECP